MKLPHLFTQNAKAQIDTGGKQSPGQYLPTRKINVVMRALPTINIVGAGIGGLTLARCLKNKGIHAVVFEKNSSPARHSYRFSLQARTCQALLKILGMDEITFFERLAVDGMDGGRGLAYSESAGRSGASKSLPSAIRAHRGRLEGVLRESLDIRFDHVLESVTTILSEHVMNLKEKDKIQSTFLVDTGGVHSPIRKSMLPESRLSILPYVVFKGTRHTRKATFKDHYEPRFEGGNMLEARKGDILLQLSINDRGDYGDGVDISYIYSRPAQQDDQLHQPKRQLQQAANIAKGFFAEVSKLELEQPFKDTFDVEKMRSDRILHWLMRDILVPLDDLEALADQGVLLIGDAPHATPILGGEGANSAIEDAIELAEWISSH
jgi:monooxygenase